VREHGARAVLRAAMPPDPPLTPATYVRICRRLRPDLAREYVDGRLIAVGFNRVRPTRWVEEIDGYLDYWAESAGRPHVVGSSYNLEPRAAYACWRAGILSRVVRRLAKTQSAWCWALWQTREVGRAPTARRLRIGIRVAVRHPKLFALGFAHDRIGMRTLRVLERLPRWMVSAALGSVQIISPAYTCTPIPTTGLRELLVLCAEAQETITAPRRRALSHLGIGYSAWLSIARRVPARLDLLDAIWHGADEETLDRLADETRTESLALLLAGEPVPPAVPLPKLPKEDACQPT